MITSINSNNSIAYQGLFEDATIDLREYAKELLKLAEYEQLEILMARFPGGKELEDINETVIDEVIVISTLNDYFCK